MIFITPGTTWWLNPDYLSTKQLQTVAVAFGLKQIFDQIEDGRDGGNIGFEDDDRNQYEDECRCRNFLIFANY